VTVIAVLASTYVIRPSTGWMALAASFVILAAWRWRKSAANATAPLPR
jgi:hypothetical protein